MALASLCACMLTACGKEDDSMKLEAQIESIIESAGATETVISDDVLSQGGTSSQETNASSQESYNASQETSASTQDNNNTTQETSASTQDSNNTSQETNTSEVNTQSSAEATVSPAPVSEAVTPSPETATPTPEATAAPVDASGFAGTHGALRVDGSSLVDQNGEQIQLYGMSTHGIAWFPQYVNYDAFKTLRDDWNTNCVRLAMYTHEYAGYCSGGNKDELKTLVKNGVEYATDLGMYVIIDWHVLNEQDPNVYKNDAITFFEEMSSTYADYTNVIYEICNEPNGYATWDSVKSYANEIIPVIRANDSDAVIIVGTPTWSQNIDQAAASPLEYDNLLYALHFYAGTHKDDLRNRLDSCVSNGLPVIVSEFGMCDASGNGANDFDSTSKWMELIEKHHLSFFCWNLANKNESSSVFSSSSQATANWSDNDLSESGKWIRDYFKNK